MSSLSSPPFPAEVVGIRPMLVPVILMVKAIVVKNDGKMEEIEGLNEGKDYTTMTNDRILAAIKNAGVVGLGGAGSYTRKTEPSQGHTHRSHPHQCG